MMALGPYHCPGSWPSRSPAAQILCKLKGASLLGTSRNQEAILRSTSSNAGLGRRQPDHTMHKPDLFASATPFSGTTALDPVTHHRTKGIAETHGPSSFGRSESYIPNQCPCTGNESAKNALQTIRGTGHSLHPVQCLRHALGVIRPAQSLESSAIRHPIQLRECLLQCILSRFRQRALFCIQGRKPSLETRLRYSNVDKQRCAAQERQLRAGQPAAATWKGAQRAECSVHSSTPIA